MASARPDIDAHEVALRPAMREKLRKIRALHDAGYRPQTLWLCGVDLCKILADLGGAGFDVARGVVFRGIRIGRARIEA